MGNANTSIDEPGFRRVAHATLVDQPARVAELSALLLSRYEVVGGAIRVGGCSIDDEPIFQINEPNAAGSSYCDRAGLEIDLDQVRTLGLDSPQPLVELPRNIRPSEFEQAWNDANAGMRIHNKWQPSAAIVAVIWCKRAVGKLNIVIGDQDQQIQFQGWTKQILNGTAPLPPFVCPATGLSGFKIVADDRGQISVPEAIKECSVTQQHLVRSHLIESTLSGKFAVPEFCQQCAVSGDWLLATEIVACPRCEQPISPKHAHRRSCDGCHRIPLASPNLLQKYSDCLHEVLPSAGNEKIFLRESFSRLYLLDSSLFKMRLQVFDRATQRTLVRKEASRWWGGWKKL
jgi:hypothetical protein